jgi:hypothetical protein
MPRAFASGSVTPHVRITLVRMWAVVQAHIQLRGRRTLIPMSITLTLN